jgi:hypothetical protein
LGLNILGPELLANNEGWWSHKEVDRYREKKVVT